MCVCVCECECECVSVCVCMCLCVCVCGNKRERRDVELIYGCVLISSSRRAKSELALGPGSAWLGVLGVCALVCAQPVCEKGKKGKLKTRGSPTMQRRCVAGRDRRGNTENMETTTLDGILQQREPKTEKGGPTRTRSVHRAIKNTH